ncbi:hypothetical protein PsYK624_082790 [Phanerochaete sordida]|uniref:Uncharacterized protein n=1 Tax=Phanerochaete sordida TaxID=48140 RepID=A0A9P3LE42_9APHY|nr:hypothetical protein PsYK624_082790 [Phanerochaete sordida]
MSPTRVTSRTTQLETAELADGDDWILKTLAKKTYNLSDADLEALKPVGIERNPHGGRHPMVKYSLREVRALVRRLEDASRAGSASSGTDELAKPNGASILHSTAKKRYLLSSEQLSSIKPVSIKPNPHGGPVPMKHYNLCDVEALADRVNAARAPPSPAKGPADAVQSTLAGPSTPPPAKRRRKVAGGSYYHDDDPNPFDGMSPDAAKAKMSRILRRLGANAPK